MAVLDILTSRVGMNVAQMGYSAREKGFGKRAEVGGQERHRRGGRGFFS